MHVDDVITHQGVIDRALRGFLPCIISAGVVRVNSDNMKIVAIFELAAVQRLELAAKDEMQKLPGRLFIVLGHEKRLWVMCRSRDDLGPLHQEPVQIPSRRDQPVMARRRPIEDESAAVDLRDYTTGFLH